MFYNHLKNTHRLGCHCFALLIALHSTPCLSQEKDSLPSPHSLKKLSLEELMDVEVISVSKRPEKLADAASAVQVITREDIRQSGAKTLTEALRLAPNLEVAKVNSSQWAISARGFNNVLANKLLVLVDGRSVYTPLYAGVFWDVQNLLLEDVDRIEVISGPGGTLWGANAVNGIINIITRHSRDTKGLYVEGATGTDLPGLGSLRYGGNISPTLSYRVYGTGFELGNTVLPNGSPSHDRWHLFQGGGRLDWDNSERDRLSMQTNAYRGRPNPDGGDTSVLASGENAVFRWNHSHSDISDFQLQAYYDKTLRDFGNGFAERLQTYDLDWQNWHKLSRRHALTYGADLRLMVHRVANLQLFEFLPDRKTLYLYSVFVQDEWTLVPESLQLTLGTKIEHNSYTGFEYQPNVRLSWKATRTQTIWGSVSRAVRTPSRIDRDFSLLLTPTIPIISGNSGFKSENVIAYELGWRVHPKDNLSFSLSTFYNVYDNIRTAEPGPPPNGIPITFGNGVQGTTFGIELSATQPLTGWWTLRGGYSLLKKTLTVKGDSKDLNKGSAESNDPEDQVLVQSTMELPGHVELGTVVRYVGDLPDPKVPSYLGLDVRIAWTLNKVVELSLTAQNLSQNRHTEFIPSSPSEREIQRSVYGKIICRL
ncbi:MAG: TonB-dependent receptor [Bacteroidota bacterium]|nr:TonB-dependent receptor [Bacteroidota bacterium]MDP4246770.1 TonB-dependent receptor [Bacteroidota bacterium]MDP4259598.1 TonB-dependent receptor [Bacteroidota bacterium]